MFYAEFVLSKKGPLAKIWLAAHWEKKLSKAQIYETDVDEAVNEIMEPKSNLALRTTGHLLLGIVKIYSRKTKYLLADCNEAFLKIKLAFRPGLLDAPNETVPVFSIQDVYGDIDTTLPEFNEADYNNGVISQSRYDDITLKEDITRPVHDYYALALDGDDFGEIAAGVNEDDINQLTAEAAMDYDDLDMASGSSDLFGREREPTPCLDNAHAPGAAIFGDDDFAYDGDNMEDDGLIDPRERYEGVHHDHHHDHHQEPHHDQIHDEMMQEPLTMDNASEIMPLSEAYPHMMDNDDVMSVKSFTSNTTAANEIQGETAEQYYERQEKRKQKKRRLTVDESKSLTGEEMKYNISNYRDTLMHLELACPSKKLMKLKKLGTVEKLLHFPGSPGLRVRPLVRTYQSRLQIKKSEEIEMSNESVKHMLGLTDIREEDVAQAVELQAMEEPGFVDDFEEIAPIDFDNFDINSPEHVEMMEERVPSPLLPVEYDDFASPTEKKKDKKRALADEDEPQAEGDEDNRWSKRTQTFLNTIANKINSSEDEEIALSDLMTKGSTRKTAAQKFYTLLVLKKWQAIEVAQAAPYEEVFITPGPNIGQTTGQ